MSAYNEIFKSSDTGLTFELTENLPTSTKGVSMSIVSVDENTGEISLTFGAAPKKSTGVQVLLDKITLALLTTFGESLFNPGMGSLITQIKVQNTSDTLELHVRVTSALASVKKQILEAQAGQTLAANQLLVDLQLSDIYLDPTDSTTVLVEVIVVTESNEEYILTV
jgi:hypothetical protein